jgi:hypothetical protein
MALQIAREGLHLPHLLPGDNAQLYQGSILDEYAMPLAEEKAVPARILQRLGIEAHLLEVKGRHDLSERARTAQVSHLADADHPHNVGPEVACDPFDPPNLVRRGHPFSSRRGISPYAQFRKALSIGASALRDVITLVCPMNRSRMR